MYCDVMMSFLSDLGQLVPEVTDNVYMNVTANKLLATSSYYSAN